MKANASLSENYNDRLSSKKGSFLSYVNKLFLTLLLGLLFVSGINAQTAMSFEKAMQKLEPAEAAHFQSLLSSIHPTAYLTQGEKRTNREEDPMVAVTDAASLNMLYGNSRALSQVELIRIAANSSNDLPASIDLIQLERLTNLKYLLIVFNYDACGGGTDDCRASIVEGIIQGASSQITVIYSYTICN